MPSFITHTHTSHSRCTYVRMEKRGTKIGTNFNRFSLLRYAIRLLLSQERHVQVCMEECDEREGEREISKRLLPGAGCLMNERTNEREREGEMRKPASKPKSNHNQIDSSFSSPYIVAARQKPRDMDKNLGTLYHKLTNLFHPTSPSNGSLVPEIGTSSSFGNGLDRSVLSATDASPDRRRSSSKISRQISVKTSDHRIVIPNDTIKQRR